LPSLVWFGYLASGIIVLSMTMSSIVYFRWLNLLGAICFSIYGFLLGAIPVGLLNGLIVCIDIYYLWIIYTKKEVFEILEIRLGSEYLIRFLDYHKNEIHKINPGFEYHPSRSSVSYFILRNMQVAGLFLAHKEGNDTLVIGLDYVIPEYRDFKNGRYIYNRLTPDLQKAGIVKIKAEETTSYNEAYFKKIGFRKDENGLFTLHLSQKSI
jgi:hypothetical protein